MRPHEGSNFVRHVACSGCGSSDANGEYDDGHTHCFACGRHVGANGSARKAVKKVAANLIEVKEYSDIAPRGLTEATCRHFGYGMGRYKFKGQEKPEPVQIAPYYDKDGNLAAQKIRGKDKKFAVAGDINKALPFGAHAFPKTGRKLVVTEGEIDALSVSQVQGNKWPVVSIGCGADKPFDDNGNELPGNKVRRYFADHLDYFKGFEEVVLMFDSDEQGVFSARIAAEVLGSRASIASLPLHDPNDMLVAGRQEELNNAIWRAEKWKPDGIVNVEDLITLAMQPVEMGRPWFSPTLTAFTYGKRDGEVYVFGAPEGGGKTDIMMEDQAHNITVNKRPVAIFSFEQRPVDVARRLAGKLMNKRFHIPDGSWTKEELEDGLRRLGRWAFIYDSKSSNDWDTVRSKVEYLFHAEGVRDFYIDNLTVMALAGDLDEKEELERIMQGIEELTKLGMTFYVVSHLNGAKDGKSHAEGGRITLANFFGSKRITQLTHFAFGLERDQQNEDLRIRTTNILRVLKDRYTGNSLGRTMFLGFNQETGRVFETTDPYVDAADDAGFNDESTADWASDVRAGVGSNVKVSGSAKEEVVDPSLEPRADEDDIPF